MKGAIELIEKLKEIRGFCKSNDDCNTCLLSNEDGEICAGSINSIIDENPPFIALGELTRLSLMVRDAKEETNE